MKQDWESKKLGEVAKIGAGNSAPQDKSLFTNGVYPFFRTSDIGKIRIGGVSTAVDLLNDQGIKKLKLYPKGTILLPKSGASTFLNHRVILDVDGFVSSHLATVVCNEDLLDKRFALHYLIGIKAQDLIQDHSYPSLKLSDIKEIPITLPPLEEQKQIVAKLDQCFEAIDKAKANAAKNLENAKELFQSRLNDIFSQKGEGWVEKKFGDVCEIIGGSQPSKQLFIYEPKDDYVRLVQVRDYRTDKFITYIPRNKTKKFCSKDDIMIGRYGPPIFGIFSGIEGAYNVALMKAVPDEDMLYKEYFRWFLKNKKLHKFVERSSARAAGQSGVRKDLLYKYLVPIPSLEVQNKIAQLLDKLKEQTQSLETKYQQELNSLEELKKSILQKAFEGEL